MQLKLQDFICCSNTLQEVRGAVSLPLSTITAFCTANMGRKEIHFLWEREYESNFQTTSQIVVAGRRHIN